jgi:hypothetical protein
MTFPWHSIPEDDPMRRWLLAAVTTLFLIGSLSAVRADKPAPPPDRPPAPAGQKAKLVVEVDPNVKEPRLIIPRSLANPPKRADAGFGLPTIVAGVALTLAVVSAGFWFIRRGPGRTIAAAVVVVSLFAFGVSALYADIPVEPKPKPPATVKLPADLQLPEDVVIEFSDKGDAIRLIVKKATSVNGEKIAPPKDSE